MNVFVYYAKPWIDFHFVLPKVEILPRKPLFVKKNPWDCPLSDSANYCLSGGATALVAVKTLKPGATAQTREDFMRESELMADLRHPNIVCLIGVVTKDEPRYNFIRSFI